MVEIDIPLEYRDVIACLYKQVKCQLKMNSGFSKHFLSNTKVKQGCPLSPTDFGLRCRGGFRPPLGEKATGMHVNQGVQVCT